MQAAPVRSDDVPPSSRGSSLGPWAGWVVVTMLLVALYADVIREMVVAWMTEMGASHGLIIPPLVALIIWIERERIMRAPVELDIRGLWLVPLGSLLYLVGRLGAEFFLTRLSLICNITGLIWVFWGRYRLSLLKFPLLLLTTMIPIPQLIYKTVSGPLQLLASTAATDVARWAGVSVFQDGNVINLAGMSLGVEEACSGMQSISALVIGSLLLGFLNLQRNWARAVLCFVSFPIAILANVVRVSGTAILADRWQEIATGFYHYFSGWAVFLTAIGLLMAVAAGLRKLEGRFA